MRKILISNKEKIIRADYADGFLDKAKGLMFSSPPKDKGLILECSEEGIMSSAIHMLFVFFPLDIVWINSKKKVVDIKKVMPFTPIAVPKQPAKYVLELPVGYAKQFKIGDKLKF